MLIPTLPKDARVPTDRALALDKKRTKYLYTYSYLPPIPMTAGMPDEERFSTVYELRLLPLFERLISNHIDSTAKYFVKNFRQFTIWDTPELLTEVRKEGFLTFAKSMMFELLDEEVVRAQSIDEYKELFSRIKEPPLFDVWDQDWFFAHQRVAGLNPTMIKRIDRIPENFPVTEEIFRKAITDGTTLDEALGSGRLYVCDYKILDDLLCGEIHGLRKHIAVPLGMFYMDPKPKDPKQRILPVAIQLGQVPGTDTPIFTPADGYNWKLAKLFFNTADCNQHEGMAHLGECHLTVEPMILATHRRLSEEHPVFTLLKPHFRFTIAINDEARRSLITPGGVVDTILACQISSTLESVVRGYDNWGFDKSMPRNTFERRGVDDPDVTPDFPFRDDTLLLWDAIQRFVGGYLRVYYQSDAEVVEDIELQAWVRELTAEDGARVKGMSLDAKGGIDSLDYLIDVVTNIIYIAGPKHASVNFAQRRYMTFPPNVSAALYGPPPDGKSEENEQSFVDRLPPIDMAIYQQEFAFFLGSYFYDKLGHYASGDFKDPKLKRLLNRFKRDLAEIEDTIDDRNELRPFRYEGQLPSRIPNSISI